MMMYLLDNALFMSEISLLKLKNKETKNASLFRYFRKSPKSINYMTIIKILLAGTVMT